MTDFLILPGAAKNLDSSDLFCCYPVHVPLRSRKSGALAKKLLHPPDSLANAAISTLMFPLPVQQQDRGPLPTIFFVLARLCYTSSSSKVGRHAISAGVALNHLTEAVLGIG